MRHLLFHRARLAVHPRRPGGQRQVHPRLGLQRRDPPAPRRLHGGPCARGRAGHVDPAGQGSVAHRGGICSRTPRACSRRSASRTRSPSVPRTSAWTSPSSAPRSTSSWAGWGSSPFRERLVWNLSGGQIQKLGIAAVLSLSPADGRPRRADGEPRSQVHAERARVRPRPPRARGDRAPGHEGARRFPPRERGPAGGPERGAR